MIIFFPLLFQSPLSRFHHSCYRLPHLPYPSLSPPLYFLTLALGREPQGIAQCGRANVMWGLVRTSAIVLPHAPLQRIPTCCSHAPHPPHHCQCPLLSPTRCQVRPSPQPENPFPICHNIIAIPSIPIHHLHILILAAITLHRSATIFVCPPSQPLERVRLDSHRTLRRHSLQQSRRSLLNTP